MQTAWLIWFAAFLAVFGALEAFAVATHRPTLSRTVWRVEVRYPILAFLAGVSVGALALHFFGWLPACKPGALG